MKKCFLLTLSLFVFLFSFTQNIEHIKIAGRVLDSTSRHPIEYATISVYKKGASAPFEGSVSDTKGNFEVDAIQNTDITVVVGFIGYQARSIDVLTGAGGALNVGAIKLLNTSVMNTVVVTASRPLIENRIDKMVYNVEKDVSSQGGVATDVLKKVPQVTVDIDGNVQLLGSS